jgi:hypothetical protein
MNIKTIILGCVTVGIATGGVLFNKLQTTNEATYTPRTAQKQLHKGSAEYSAYIHSLKANQITGEVDLAEYNKVKQEVLAISKQNNKAALNMLWENQGPDNVGGRMRAILVDNSNSNLIYAGSVAGGLYISNDGGGTWNAVEEMSDNLAISCITQTTSGRIFFGTGSTFDESGGQIAYTPGFIGNGVYEYVPANAAGSRVVPILVNTGNIPNNSTGGDFTYINAIASKGERLYVGSKKGLLLADPTSGNYPSTISGWTNPIHVIKGQPLLETARVNDIDVGSDGSMVVCMSGKVYHSFSDADDSFTRTGMTGSRISAAIAPSDPSHIYVVSTSNTLNGLYISRTFDANNKPEFTKVVPGGAPSIDPFLQNGGTGNGQGTWDQTIAVDPANKERCIVGGIQLYEFNLIPNSVPLGGNWVKIAHLSEMIGAPYYMHADKHTIWWKNANTIFIGNDGGVYKSTDGGITWTENNFGLNTTTFFTVSTNALGWIMGGSQDNGCQLVAFGALGTVTPLGAIEVTGGDGFDTEFSNLGGGIAFTTSQEGALYRSSIGGQGGTFFDGELYACTSAGGSNCGIFHTSISYWESFNDPLTRDSIQITFDSTGTLTAGQVITYPSLTNGMDLYYTVPTTMAIDTTDTLMFPDYVQHKMSYAGSGTFANTIYVTRQAASLGATYIDWARVADNDTSRTQPDAFSGTAYVMEFTPDGNTLFVGSSNGKVYRIDNLSMANDSLGLDVRSASHVTTCTQIASTGRTITGLAIDPNNANNVIITLGNYSNSVYIYRTTSALTDPSTTSGLGSFQSIQGPNSSAQTGYLPRMPIYDAEIDLTDNDKVIIGTEWGVWATDNAFSGTASSVKWTEENSGVGHVPVFQIRQQTLYGITDPNSGAPLTGMYYLGTHGKGFWSSSTLVTGVEDINEELTDGDKFVSNLNVYPNPMNDIGNISFNLQNSSETIAKIYNLTGSLVKTIDFGKLSKGKHNERFDASDLSIGSYFVSIESGENRSVAKFIVTR